MNIKQMDELPKKISKPGDLFECRVGHSSAVILMYLDTIVDSRFFKNNDGIIHLFLSSKGKIIKESTLGVKYYYTRITNKTKVNGHETEEK